MTAQVWMPPPVGWVDGDVATRAWIKDLHDRIIGVGLVQAADTGQIDPETYVAPTNSNTSYTQYMEAGYLIYRFDDDLQDDFPIFLKITLVQKGYADAPCVGSIVQIGTSTDGEGELTGSVSSVISIRPGRPGSSPEIYDPVSASGASRITYSKDRGFFALCFSPTDYMAESSNYTVKYAPICFAISRTQDSDGTPTDKGASIWSAETQSGDNNYNSSYSSVVNNCQSSSITQNISGQESSLYSFATLAVPYLFGDDLIVQRAYHRVGIPECCYNIVMIGSEALPEGQEFGMISGGVTESNFVCLGTSCAMKPSAVSGSWVVAVLFE